MIFICLKILKLLAVLMLILSSYLRLLLRIIPLTVIVVFLILVFLLIKFLVFIYFDFCLLVFLL